MTKYVYGCLSAPEADPRDLQMGDAVAGAVLPSHRLWRHGPILDQGQTPQCVAHAGTAWGNCLPVDDHWQEQVAHDIYAACKKVDGNNEDGTYVRSLAKVLVAAPYARVGKYAFGDIDAARAFVLGVGPVVQGIPWTEGMETPDANGVIHPTGEVVGGHGTCIIGSTGQTDADMAVIQNSWTIKWGLRGLCYILWGELRTVAYGTAGFRPEFMSAIELPLGVAPVAA